LRPAEAERIARDLYGLAATISALPVPRLMPFRREHADLLVQAIDAAATAVDRGLA